MRFRLNKLLGAPIGAQQFERLDRGRTWLDDDLQVNYLRGDLSFTRTNECILIEGDIESACDVQCVRSLEAFELPITIILEDVAFTLPGFTPVESDRKIKDDGYIDLTETIRELAIMTIPINPIHPRFKDADSLTNLIDSTDTDWLSVKWADSDDGGQSHS